MLCLAAADERRIKVDETEGEAGRDERRGGEGRGRETGAKVRSTQTPMGASAANHAERKGPHKHNFTSFSPMKCAVNNLSQFLEHNTK